MLPENLKRILRLCDDFESYLQFCEDNNSFQNRQWQVHRETMALRNQFETVEGAIFSDRFLRQLRDTLASWNMDRGARLASYEEFIESFRSRAMCARLVALEEATVSELMDTETEEYPGIFTYELLLLTIQGLELSKGRKQIVTGSKALHHLLPKLLPPIDQRYTGMFFADMKTYDVEFVTSFTRILEGFSTIASHLEEQCGEGYLANLVGSTPLATSETKLIDNAIIGYVKKHGL